MNHLTFKESTTNYGMVINDGLTRQQRWQIKNKEYRKSYLKQFYKKLKIEVFSIYSKGTPKCACCGESHIDFLSMDHMKPRKEFGHKNSWGGPRLYSWLKRNNYPVDFQVLCMNCNWAKGKFGKCPHKTQLEGDLEVL